MYHINPIGGVFFLPYYTFRCQTYLFTYFSSVSVSENVPLDLYVSSKLDPEALLYTVSDHGLFMDSLALGNTLGASLRRFKFSNCLKDFKSFIFLEACLFH